MRRYVIVGSGIAGMSAAETLRQRDPSAEITVVSEEPHDFYSRPGLAYLLSGEIPEKQLFPLSRAELRDLKLKWIKTSVARMQPDAHTLTLASGQSVPYDRLLLAPGSTAVAPDFPIGALKGVVKLDNLDDARHILRLAQRGRTAVVVGGGITALELVEGLRARGMTVHYFLRGERYWSNVLDETESRIVENRLRAEGVAVHYHTEVKQIVGKQGWVVGVETVAGERLSCHLVAFAIGVRPRFDLARQAGLATDRGMVVNEFMQTSASDVYAAGDVAQVYDPRSKRAILDTLWSTALAQARAAGTNMAGAPTPYVKGIAFNVTRLAGLTTTIIGAVGSGKDQDLLTIARGDSESWRLAPAARIVSDQQEVNRIRLLVGERTLVGALVMGDQTLSRPLQNLIAAQVDITPIRENLKANPAGLVPAIQDLHRQWERAGHASNL